MDSRELCSTVATSVSLILVMKSLLIPRPIRQAVAACGLFKMRPKTYSHPARSEVETVHPKEDGSQERLVAVLAIGRKQLI